MFIHLCRGISEVFKISYSSLPKFNLLVIVNANKYTRLLQLIYLMDCKLRIYIDIYINTLIYNLFIIN